MPQGFRPWLTDSALWTAWQKQLAEATATPWLWRELLQHGPDLFSRFAGHYRRLRALPRRLRRALQHQWKQSLAGVALLFSLQPTSSWAANFTAATAKELIAAIKTANTTPRSDTITLTANITLTLPANTGGAGLPAIWSPITIVGNGHTIAGSRKMLSFDGILTVRPTGNLTLQGTKIRGGLNRGNGGGIFNDRGTLTLTNSTVSGNFARIGGGIFNDRGTLTLTNSTVSGNKTGGDGGGIFNDHGTLKLTHSAVLGNTTPTYGGGIFNDDGTLTLTNSTVSGNKTGDHGGGVSNFGTVTLTHSTVSGNSAQFGGGVDNDGTVMLTNSTVSGNSAAKSGGGVSNSNYMMLANSTVSGNKTGGDGGGVSNFGAVILTHSTVSGNSAAKSGGGVFNSPLAIGMELINSTVSGNKTGGDGGGVYNSGEMGLTNSTISGNTAANRGGGLGNYSDCYYSFNKPYCYANVTLSRSLISGNTAPIGAELSIRYTPPYYAPPYTYYYFVPPTTTLTLFGHSGLTNGQAFTNFNFTPSATDITATSNGTKPTTLTAILNPTLANNGGPTDTHNLVTGSPAIDAAPADANCPATDQRGASRPFGPKCDLGAVEFGATPPFAFTGFFHLAAPHGAFNMVQAGQGVPLTFSLDGDQGLDILAEGSPTSRAIACDPTAPTVDVETPMTLAGGSRLSYDGTTDTYTYVWQTASRWANTCRQLIVRLRDGTKHRAKFWFKK